VIPEIWEMMVEVMAHHAMTAHANVTTSYSGRAYAYYCNGC
jgi:predicted SprT family Zn-dependent metalloprotease